MNVMEPADYASWIIENIEKTVVFLDIAVR